MNMSKTNNGEIVGYARVSSVGQSLDVQNDKLRNAGATKIFQEKKSGVDRKRPQLTAALDYVREGDSLVISRIDRLARSVSHLSQVVDELREKGVSLVVTDQQIDTRTAAGRAMLQLLGVFAEFENSIRAERQRDGIEKAKAEDEKKGVNRFGRPKVLTDETIALVKQLKADKVPMPQIEIRTGLSRASIYRALC